MANKESAFYLPGLTGIRAIAALMVLVGHANQFLYLFNLEALFINQNPSHGVTLFFVLSGFLISLLLMKEKEKFGVINLKQFYIRRILRIWPLYYLMVLITFCTLFFFPGLIEGELNNILLYLFFVPNLALATNRTFLFIEPLWSVGVEEQFYLFWPIIVSVCWTFLLRAFKIICSLYIIIYLIAMYYGTGEWFIFLTRFDCMAIGAIAAYLHHRQLIDFRFYSTFFQKLMFILFILSIVVVNVTPYPFEQECYAIFYAALIAQIVHPGFMFIRFFENIILKFIGDISYGIYIYHVLVIFSLSILFEGLTMNSYFLIGIIFSVTLLLSYISFKYFESPFLKLKKRHANIATKTT